MKTRLIIALLITVLCAGMYMLAGRQESGVISKAYAQQQQVTATAREATIQGIPVGEVVVNGQVVFRIRTAAGGYSPLQRAQAVAQRINNIGPAFNTATITTGVINNQRVVLANGRLLITAPQPEANINGVTTTRLAQIWASNLGDAAVGRQIATGPSVPAGTGATSTPTAQKVVPIISVGQGTRVGGALVTGTQSRVGQVVAVAQVEAMYGNAVRVRLLIPVSSENVVQNISRVPQTSVAGLVDIRL